MESQRSIRLEVETLDGYNFRGQDLGWTLFDEMELHDVDFSHANLEMANFTHATLVRCNFSSANLKNADFSDAHLKGCIFTDADLTRAKFLRTLQEE